MDVPVNPVWQQNLFLGSWQNGDGEQIDIMEPATGEVITQLKAATPLDVDRAAIIAKPSSRSARKKSTDGIPASAAQSVQKQIGSYRLPTNRLRWLQPCQCSPMARYSRQAFPESGIIGSGYHLVPWVLSHPGTFPSFFQCVPCFRPWPWVTV